MAGISEEEGLEHFLIAPKSICHKEFIDFLNLLSDKYEGKPLTIFLDNLQVHKSNEVKEAYKRLAITPIFNIPYSPQFNGIESYFSLVKTEYKKLLLKHMLSNSNFEVVSLIKQSLKHVKS